VHQHHLVVSCKRRVELGWLELAARNYSEKCASQLEALLSKTGVLIPRKFGQREGCNVIHPGRQFRQRKDHRCREPLKLLDLYPRHAPLLSFLSFPLVSVAKCDSIRLCSKSLEKRWHTGGRVVHKFTIAKGSSWHVLLNNSLKRYMNMREELEQ